MNPYEKCPVFENENYLLRLVEPSDRADLLLVYSDEKAVPYFNSDNCNGDDFHYTTTERMKSAIDFWLLCYAQKGFVRWAVIHKKASRADGSAGGIADDIACAIGTVELFNRQAADYFNNCGLLRLDLRSDYEQAESIREILSLVVPSAFELFDCQMIATKIPPFAACRMEAAKTLGFTACREKLIGGDDGREYGDYFVLLK